MSRFDTQQIACPACGTPVRFATVHSVNADRRPDLRDEILAGVFQRSDCAACGARFRLDPHFNYLDIARRQWIVAAPVAAESTWLTREVEAQQLFERAYGDDAPDAARDIGARLRPRITFGWPALREKVLAAAHQIDDLALEACKAVVMRGVDGLPFSPVADLRLADVDGKRLFLAWLRNYDSAEGDAVELPRRMVDTIAAEIADDAEGGWRGLTRDFDGALFVDLNRIMVRQPGGPARI